MKSHLHPSILRRRRAAGVSIITAIFLLVVLAGLGVAMLTISTAQQTGSALDVQGERAYQAARAGIEWALYRGLPPNSDACPAGSFRLPPDSTLSTFTVTVTCTQATTALASGGVLTRHHLQATACNQPNTAVNPPACGNPGPNSDYVERSLQADF